MWRILLWRCTGAGSGWAKTILFNDRLKEMFTQFFARTDSFALGVCNGCQMMAQLREIIPEPRAGRTLDAMCRRGLRRDVHGGDSELSLAVFEGMAGSRVPIVVAHGEGHVSTIAQDSPIALRYIDTYGNATEYYPLNRAGPRRALPD